ncbi:MAG: DNA gyrase/topoisomerase IV subunit A [Flavobacteriales bacterium]|nr:DNA gyrase/topoisomerase IV subunit A [Flavobacteriales bacterium]
MAENEEKEFEEKDEEFEALEPAESDGDIILVSGMYEEWFLDYASYVILERAVPHVNDGLKPVQRRILHSLKELDDGRFNKVANVVGNTMKYHPHGDASIADAMVALGQKELLIDTQGNWGNIHTGDRAAASRYIEARLSKFALEVLFNAKTTNWQASYDGRNKEPVTLPSKFPLLLAQGVEGIAVGLSCKILPHNFLELIDGSIKALQGKRPKIYPDFPTGGMADFSNYNDGERGGRVRVRAKISSPDKKSLLISEVPFGTTTTSVIDSILKANDKGKIKIKKVEDNTADVVEILVHLAPGVSPDKTIDALYAFTDCEVSISPNAVIIENDKPRFVGVGEILQVSAENTKDLLRQELEIKKGELQEQWHFSSLEKIFIENKIYIEFDGKSYDEAIEVTHKLLKPHIKNLKREVTNDDVVRLLEIRMRRITKHDSDKADNLLLDLEAQLKEVQFHLDNLTDYAIDFFKNLKKKYGEGKERKTEIKSFENIERAKVAVANAKLYVNYKEGFAGTGLKRTESEYIKDCSDIDNIIVIRSDGKLIVSKISEKAFFGKDILYVNVWKKGDERTTYNLIYQDGKTKYVYAKRFSVTSITRDKEYDLGTTHPATKIIYLTANPNGEAETIKVLLRPRPKIKRLKFDFDFSELAIKGRSAKGNTLTKHLIHKIELKEEGVSTLGAMKIWWDDTVQRLNSEGRGRLVGEFLADDRILTIHENGNYKLSPYALITKFDEGILIMEKYNPEKVYSMIYWDGEKENYYVKRFNLETTDKATSLIGDHEKSQLEFVSDLLEPKVNLVFDKRSNDRPDEEINLADFISVKGQKALGNRLTTYKVKAIEEIAPTESDLALLKSTYSKPTSSNSVNENEEDEDDEADEKEADEVSDKVAKPAIDKKVIASTKTDKDSTEKKATEPKREKVEEVKGPGLEKVQKEDKTEAVEKTEAKPKTATPPREAKTDEPKTKPKKGGDLPPEGPVQITLEL